MTRFTVVWHRDALMQLADLWTESPDPASITSAADRIDRELRENPESKGRIVGDQLRLLRIQPLDVLYEIDSDDAQVKVVMVRHID